MLKILMIFVTTKVRIPLNKNKYLVERNKVSILRQSNEKTEVMFY